MEETVRVRFNQILQRHYERLTGTMNVAGGLPLTLDNIGFFILFGGREMEVCDINSEISERYTMEEFLREVGDAGIEADEHFQAAMHDLMQKKYIEQRPDGHIHGYSDARETAGILNRVFPKMQGLNLLAYIWQMIAEVTSGRTDLESALSRFDQTLNNHGVIPPKPKIIPVIKREPEKPAAPEKKEPGLNRRGGRIIRNYVVSETPARPAPSASMPAGSPPASHGETDRDAASEKELLFSAARKENEEKLESAGSEVDQKIQAETEAMKQKIAELEEAIAAEKEKQAPAAEVVPPAEKEEGAGAVEAGDPRDGVAVDDEVAKKIAAFEKELALSCPICKTGVLREKSTAAGKLFYTCETKNCNFISWGKPHHIHCARCKNPFLIEATDAAGQTFLRCPRATCQYRQALNAGSGVRVVRKRVVRRAR